MPSEKEEKYMETNTATINREKEKTSLLLTINGKILEILLTEDNPINVKSVFNDLLKELQGGLFKFELDDEEESDLFHHVCNEYITQLNTELQSVYTELEEYGLLTIS